jgi:MFS family permease
MEISSSIGYIAGPLLGGILYQLGGYKAPFLCFSIIIIVSAPIIYKLLSK